MIQGEPLEETKHDDAQSAESVGVGPVMQVPDRSDDKPHGDDALSIAMGLSTQQDDSLDTEVQELVEAIADVERDRDDDWIEAAQADTALDEVEAATDSDDDLAEPHTIEDAMLELERIDLDRVESEPSSDSLKIDDFRETDFSVPDVSPKEESADTLATLVAEDDADGDGEAGDKTSGEEQPSTGSLHSALSFSDLSTSDMDDDAAPTIDTFDAPEEKAEVVQDVPVDEAQANSEPSPNLLGLQAINVLNEKISSSEGRYDDALGKIGHALGVIAERIDGLEGRMTSKKIADVAIAAAPSMPSMQTMPSSFASTTAVSDDSVAPYIAQAERELEARKESGPMDIFDRIAKAAETEYDGHSGATETRVLENSSDGRRVGTKRWQPSKTVKRRMEQLEKAKNGELTGDPTFDVMPEEPRTLRADVEEITSGVNAPRKSAAAAAAKPMLDLDDEFEEDDDAGLSVVPGARGRRKNRARKSRLDEDFENVFEETEGKPSIQSLRRKMRDRPVEEPVEEEVKGSMLGGILGKKSAKKATKAEPVEPVEDDEDDLMAAFDAPAPSAKKSKKAKAVVDVEEDDEDWDDEETSKGINFAGGPLLYVLIAALAAAAFFAYQKFML